MPIIQQKETKIKASPKLSTNQVPTLRTMDGNSLARYHKLGIKGIFTIHSPATVVKKPPFLSACVVFILSFIFQIFSAKDSFTIVNLISEIGIVVIPSLLGFSLGGFALIVGFGNKDVIKNMAEFAEANQPSLYQSTTAIFAYSLLLQSFCLVVTMIVKAFIAFEVPALTLQFGYWINLSINSLLLFFYTWALVSVIYVVLNIFTFSQSYHLFLLTEDSDKHD